MGKVIEVLTEKDRAWVNAQKIFFVATAPLSPDGHINCSPKGGDCFNLLSSTEFIYADYTGSGIETAAHVLENQRMCVMFCAFEGPPRIVRLHGQGEIIAREDSRFATYQHLFSHRIGIRAFIRLSINRISSSCGFQVPYFQYEGEREVLEVWEEKKGVEGLKQYQREKNSQSIDGLKVPFFS